MEQLQTKLIPPLQAVAYQQQEEKKREGVKENGIKKTGSPDLNQSHLHNLSELTQGGGRDRGW